MGKRRKLFVKLYPSYLIMVIIPLLAITWYYSSNSRSLYLKEKTDDLEAGAHIIEAFARKTLGSDDYSELIENCQIVSEDTKMRITIISKAGIVLIDTDKSPEHMERHDDRPEIITAFEGKLGSSVRYSTTLEQHMLYVAIPAEAKGGQDELVIRVSLPLKDLDSTLSIIYYNIFIGVILVIIIAALVSFFVARRLTAPLEELNNGVSLITKGSIETRLEIPDIEEYAQVAWNVNDMAEQLTQQLIEITEQSNERDAILASMLEGVIAIDNESNIININKAARKLFNTTKEAKGKTLQEAIRNTSLQNIFEEILKTGEQIEREFHFYNQGNRIIKAKGTTLRDAEEVPIGALVVFSDITKIRQLENFRRDFVANVSHEIRTPLTVILGAAEALQDGALECPEDTEHFLGSISKHADRLNALVSDILDLSKVERMNVEGKLECASHLVDNVISTVLDLCKEKANAKSIDVKVDCEDELFAHMDNQLMEQALVNLVVNAIKYSEENKEITISAKSDRNTAVLTVSDNGYGIPHNHLPRLFERFYRVDKARSRKEGGTGLGLAIVKHIVQAHNGEVSVESEHGVGTTFTIVIPK